MIAARDLSRGEIAIFQAPDGEIKLDVHLERDTIWLSLNQLATLFDRDKSVISRHLNRIFKEGELDRAAVVAKSAATAADGKAYQVDHFNLDAIIAVGSRINSERGAQFRVWASRVLRDHILKGYTANLSRLRDLDKAVKLVANTPRRSNTHADEVSALLSLTSKYSHALGLLDDYDHQRVAKPEASGKVVHVLEYEEATRIVANLRNQFPESEIFGEEKDQGLASALGAIMQTAFSRDVYPSLEEKAANLLYFLVKNHAFVDGNKRIAAALFLWFLERNEALVSAEGKARVSNSTLVALTLMIAESRPEEKDTIARIIVRLLCEGETV